MLQHGVSLGLRNLHKKGEGLQPLGYASPPSFRTERSFMIRSEYALCRHTKTDGRRCQSPALSTSAFCYFHQKLRRTHPSTIGAGPGLSTHVLHPLRNARSIQLALSMVFNGVLTGQIHPNQARKMLSALRLAAKL